MPTPSLFHPVFSEIDDQVFALQESARKLELVEESLHDADPRDAHHWQSILHRVMEVETTHMRQAFEQLKSLSCYQEGIL